eukprot:TRINITY_DN5099_c0_g1_i3.p1 TRINITY_DN5099_c0_g1~~TRINITY_DN5099_c0_g1_i3.p1  ORF type:complete len:441 (+),score=44.50 TRINITY_DN5099_c0_g1_i3:104-1324(+)
MFLSVSKKLDLDLEEYRLLPNIRAFFHYKRTSVVNIAEDGTCLFRCLSRCIHGTQTHHRAVRAAVCDEIEKNGDAYDSFITVDFSTYISRMRKEHVWGGELELAAAAHISGRAFLVLDADDPARDHVVGDTRRNGAPHVLGFVNNEHYVLLIDTSTSAQFRADRVFYEKFSQGRMAQLRSSREEAQRLGREERARQRRDHFYIPPAPVCERKGSEEMEEESDDDSGGDRETPTSRLPLPALDGGAAADKEREREQDQMMGALTDAMPQESNGTGDEHDAADVTALRAEVSKLKKLLVERNARIAELEEAAPSDSLKPSTSKTKRLRAVPRCGRPQTCRSLFHMRDRDPMGLARIINTFAETLAPPPRGSGLLPSEVQRTWMMWLAQHHSEGRKKHEGGIKGLILEV